MDFGHFYLGWGKREDALKQFEFAYAEYEVYFNKNKREHSSVLIADAAMQIAIIKED